MCDGSYGGNYGGADNGAFMAGDVSAGFGGMDPYMAGGGQAYFPGGGADFSGIPYTLGSGGNSLGGGGVYMAGGVQGFFPGGGTEFSGIPMDEMAIARVGGRLENNNALEYDTDQQHPRIPRYARAARTATSRRSSSACNPVRMHERTVRNL